MARHESMPGKARKDQGPADSKPFGGRGMCMQKNVGDRGGVGVWPARMTLYVERARERERERERGGCECGLQPSEHDVKGVYIYR